MRPKRVLIVDDDPDARAMLRTVLEAEGFEVREVNSADQALDEWSRFGPSLIVSDNRMPGTLGLDAILQIKKKVQIPIVFFSGNVDGELRDVELPLGVHVVEKPDVERLLVTVRKVMAE